MKNLVYMCVFYNDVFIKFFELFIESFILYDNHLNRALDLMVMTNSEFENDILDICKRYGVINIIINKIEVNSIKAAKMSRLSIFDYKKIDEYGYILYLDTDILLTGNLKKVFRDDIKLGEYLYVVKENDIGNNYHGKFLFDADNQYIDNKTPGFNSGVLLFKKCFKIRELFSIIKNGIETYKDKNMFLSHVDQPFFNFYTIKNNLQEMNYLDGLSINNPYGRTTHIICHFAGNNTILEKLNDMRYFLDKIKVQLNS